MCSVRKRCGFGMMRVERRRFSHPPKHLSPYLDSLLFESCSDPPVDRIKAVSENSQGFARLDYLPPSYHNTSTLRTGLFKESTKLNSEHRTKHPKVHLGVAQLFGARLFACAWLPAYSYNAALNSNTQRVQLTRLLLLFHHVTVSARIFNLGSVLSISSEENTNTDIYPAFPLSPLSLAGMCSSSLSSFRFIVQSPGMHF